MGSVVTTIGARTEGAERNVARLGATAKVTAADIGKVGAAADAAAKKTSAMPPPPAAVQSKWQAWSKQIQSNEQHIDTLSTKAGLVGAAAAAGIGLAVKTYAEFDKAMSGVAASAPEAKAALGALREEAKKSGKETVFSAKEAAGGIETLLKAGIEAQDVLGGGLKGALDLAAAGEISVADASDVAATAMVQFKLSGKDVPHIADLLAAAAGKAQGEVGDMAAALKQAGLVASGAELSLEETTGTLAAFASAGLLGSDAGTAFRTMLLRLQNPSKESATLMRDLGITAYDAQGNFVGMESLAGQLKDQLGELEPKQRDAALATIFGSDAIRAANVLYDEGSAGIQQWTKDVDDAGYAQDVAQKKTDNLIGDLERLGGAWDGLLISMGESANGPGREVVQWITDVLDGWSEMPPEFQSGALLIVAAIAGLGLGAAVIGKLVVSISEARAAMLALSATAPVASRRMATFTRGALGAGAALVALVAAASLVGQAFYEGPVAQGLEHTEAALKKLQKTGDATDLNKLFDVKPGGWDTGTGQIVDGVDNVEDAIGRLTSSNFGDWFDRTVSDLTAGLPIANPWKEMKEAVAGVDAELTEMVEGGKFEDAAVQFAKLSASGKLSVDQLIEGFPAYHQALQQQANDLEDQVTWFDASSLSARDYADWMGGKIPPAVARASAELENNEEATRGSATATAEATRVSAELAASQDQLTAAQKSLNGEIDKAIDNFTILNGGALEAEEASIRWRESLLGVESAVKENGTSLKKNTENGLSNRQMILDQTKALNDKVAANFKENSEARKGETAQQALERAYATAKKEMEKGREQLLDNTEAAGLNRDEVADLSDKVLKAPSELDIPTDAPGVKTVQQQIDDLKEQIEELKGTKVSIESEFKVSGLGELKEVMTGVDKGTFKGGNKYDISQGYHDGGYTGPGGKFDPAGIVHRDEFVVRKEARQRFEARHPGALDYLNSSGRLPGYARGGRVTRNVEVRGIKDPNGIPDIHAPIDELGQMMAEQSRAFMDAFTADAKKAVKEAYQEGLGASGAGGVIDISNPGGRVNYRGGTFSNLFAANLKKAEQIAGETIRVFQGGYRPTTSYSGTSHKGDAVDLQVSGALIRALRSVGIAAWDRTGKGPWMPHTHAIPSPQSGYAGGSAVWQWQDYTRGGDGLAGGGPVLGRGTSKSDSIPAWLSNGEFVIRTAAAKAIGYDTLAALNAVGGYAVGGMVAPSKFGSSTAFDVSVIVRLIRAIEEPIRELGEFTKAIASAKRENSKAAAEARRLREALRDTKAGSKARERAQDRYDAAADRAADAADRLRDSQSELASAQQEVAQQARSMSDQFRDAYTDSTTDVKAWSELMQTGTRDLSGFLSQVATLRGRGLSESLIQQILGMGAGPGGELASQIIAGGKPLIGHLNKVSQGLQDVSDRLGYLGATGQGRFAAGGPVSGPGTATSDSIVARVSDGEWIVPAHAVEANRRYLESITYGQQNAPSYVRGGYANGGPVTVPKIDAQALAGAVREGLAGLSWSARLNGETIDMRIDYRLNQFVADTQNSAV